MPKSTQDIVDRVSKALSDFSGVEGIRGDTPISLLEMDSLETLAAASAIEQEFSVELGDDLLLEMRTVQDVADYVSVRLAALEAIPDAG